MSFTVGAIPPVVDEVIEASNFQSDEIDKYLMHQATQKMLSLLQERLDLSDKQLPIRLQDCGNTVSATIPILIDQLRREGELVAGMKNLLIGFGVGWSWAGCGWQETFRA